MAQERSQSPFSLWMCSRKNRMSGGEILWMRSVYNRTSLLRTVRALSQSPWASFPPQSSLTSLLYIYTSCTSYTSIFHTQLQYVKSVETSIYLCGCLYFGVKLKQKLCYQRAAQVKSFVGKDQVLSLGMFCSMWCSLLPPFCSFQSRWFSDFMGRDKAWWHFESM